MNKSPGTEFLEPLPWSDQITSYDEAHFVTYIRLLDAEAAGVPEPRICCQILNFDGDLERGRRILADHLKRAKWMTTHGYKLLLRSET
jgi:hypothetical protein